MLAEKTYEPESRDSLLRFGRFTVGFKRVNGGSVAREAKRVFDVSPNLQGDDENKHQHAFCGYETSDSYDRRAD